MARLVLNMVRWPMVAALCLVVACLSALGCHSRHCRRVPSDWPDAPFSAAAWAETPSEERYRYVRSLLDGDTLMGLTRDGVAALIGGPGDPERWGRSWWQYGVAEPSGLSGIFSITVHFDSFGRVSTVCLRTD